MPAQDHLRRGPTVPVRDPHDDRVAQQFAAVAERSPGLGDDAVLGVVGARTRPGHRRVELDLVDLRCLAGLGDQPVQVGGLEVGHAHGPGQPLGAQPQQPAPGVHVPVPPGHRPVDEVEVHVVQAEPVEAVPQRLAGLALAVPLAVELRGDERLGPRHSAGPDGVADPALVAVAVRGVHQPVAARERLGDGRLGLGVVHRPRPQPEHRHLRAAGQRNPGYVHGELLPRVGLGQRRQPTSPRRAVRARPAR
jgi:hypothetical protein